MRTTLPKTLSTRLDALAPHLAPRLLAWYDHAARDLPWRQTRDPYAIWLSEAMLQQTQVETVKPYWHKFLGRFPTVADLAAADLQEVLKLWAGLGYYRRARHLHAAAQAIVAGHGGQLPATAAQLLLLPGFGRYTAGAVASIAFGQAAPVVDGNVMRVLTRLLGWEGNLAEAQTQQRLWVMAERLVPPPAPQGRPGDYNQAVMELGATVCRPVAPRCLTCPVRDLCQAAAQGRQEELPIKTARTAPEVRQLAAFCLAWRGRWLVLQRPGGVAWEHLWEFVTLPAEVASGAIAANSGGRAGANKTAQVNSVLRLADVLKSHLGVRVELEDWQSRVRHHLTHRTMEYTVYRGTVTGLAEPAITLPACEQRRYAAGRWLTPAQFSEVPMARISGMLAAAAGIK